MEVIIFCLFLWNPKYYQNEIWLSTSVFYNNISNMFLAQCWRLKTISRPFYDFNEMAI